MVERTTSLLNDLHRDANQMTQPALETTDR